MIILRTICPVCGSRSLPLTQACLHRRTVELECESCKSKSVSHIPTAAWWIHRVAFGFVGTLLVPILFIFFFGHWSVWVAALLLLTVAGGASYFLLHVRNCKKMRRGNPDSHDFPRTADRARHR